MHFEKSVIDGERRSMYVYSIGFTTAGVLMVYKKHDNTMKLSSVPHFSFYAIFLGCCAELFICCVPHRPTNEAH